MKLGTYKFYGERVLSYVQRIVSIPMTLASFKILGISYFWLLIAPVAIYVIYRLDKKYFVRGEIREAFKYGMGRNDE